MDFLSHGPQLQVLGQDKSSNLEFNLGFYMRIQRLRDSTRTKGQY